MVRKTLTVTVDEKIYRRFLEQVIKKHGKTRMIGKELDNAMLLWLERQGYAEGKEGKEIGEVKKKEEGKEAHLIKPLINEIIRGNPLTPKKIHEEILKRGKKCRAESIRKILSIGYRKGEYKKTEKSEYYI